MHSEVSLIEIIFRLSIFSLLAYKLYSLIKSYIVPMLIDEVAAKKKEQDELLGKEKLLVSTQQRVKGQIYNQKQMFILLERNVQVWQQALINEKNAQEKTNDYIIQKITRKREIQNNNIDVSMMIQAVIPQAISTATHNLELRSQSAEGREFLSTVINQLDGRKAQP
jgi:hypothetical protein